MQERRVRKQLLRQTNALDGLGFPDHPPSEWDIGTPWLDRGHMHERKRRDDAGSEATDVQRINPHEPAEYVGRIWFGFFEYEVSHQQPTDNDEDIDFRVACSDNTLCEGN